MYNYETLTNADLLKLIIREKSSENAASKLMEEFKNLPELLLHSEERELLNIKGIGLKRTQQIKATAELARRLYSNPPDVEYRISQPSDAADYIMNEMRFLKQEYLKVIILNTKNVILGVETVSIGSLNSAIVHPREVFIPAIKNSAASIIVAHNHPSKFVEPSTEDIDITKRLKECSKIIGIDLLDHIIIGNGKFVSLKEKGVI
jgi:DNA repair protein RadC